MSGPLTEIDQDGAAVALNKRPKSDLPITAEFVRNTFLFGVNLKDDDGNEMPDALIEFYIKSATRYVERELSIILGTKEIVNEAHDYYYDDYTAFGHVKLLHYPVQRVKKYAIQFPLSNEGLEFDPRWFKVDSVGGQVNLIPTEGTFSAILLGQGGSFLPLLYSGRDYIPYIISIDYTAGFEDGEVPEDILEVIAMKAALGPLNIAGDLIAGAGIANQSISLDGLSQTVGTTSSATNAGYGARIIQYEKQIKTLLSTIRSNLKGIQMVVA
jgi:hypothetical protein